MRPTPNQRAGLTLDELAPDEPRCHECGETDGLIMDAGLVMCPDCFNEVFPDLEPPADSGGEPE